MKILELFAGTRSIGKAFEARGHEVYSVAISHHRRKNEETGSLDAISDYAKFCDMVNKHVLELIKELDPKYYFIENPRGGLRKMDFMQGIPKYTVTYCQYGDTRMKPTDIFTNHPNPQFKPPCHNGDTCHDRAPRGTTVKKWREQGINYVRLGGTQYGCKNSRDRSRIPKQLCDYIVDLCEGKVRQTDKQLSFFEED